MFETKKLTENISHLFHLMLVMLLVESGYSTNRTCLIVKGSDLGHFHLK